MKTIYLALFLFTTLRTSAQNPDFLRNYSYMIYNFDTNGVAHSSTAFFYKKNNRTFLVTNYHAVTGFDTFSGKIKYTLLDSIYILYTNKQGSPSVISLYNDIGNIDFRLHYEHPDLIAKVISIPGDFKVNYINELIDTSYFNRDCDTVYTFGYPSGDQTIDVIKLLEQPHFKLIKSFISADDFETFFLSSFLQPLFFTEQKKHIKDQMKLFEIETTEFDPVGMSGSPLFGSFKKKNRTIYRFIGINFGGRPETGYGLAVDGITVYNYLSALN